jgi:glycosyltransferase involved in cell wall biosynthesis
MHQEFSPRAASVAPRRLVWLSEVPWRGLPQRHHHLVRALRECWDVLYVEPPPSLRPPSAAIVAVDDVRVAQVAPILNARVPVLQRLLRPAAVRALVARAAEAQVRRAVAAAWPEQSGPSFSSADESSARKPPAFDAPTAEPAAPREQPTVSCISAGAAASPTPEQPPLGQWRADRVRSDLHIICSNVFLTRAAAALRPARLVLDVCDDPRAFPGAPAWTAEVLRDSVRLADIVTSSSRALEREFSTLRGSAGVRYVPNGVRPDLLRPAASPQSRNVPTGPPSADVSAGRQSDVPASRPSGGSVGYLGYIGPWLDFTLLEAAADAIPDCPFELVGPVDPAMAHALDRLCRRANVCWRPPVEEIHVPTVLAGFRVGIIPFVRSALTYAVNPNKLYEYAALDLPIVTTQFSPDLAPFAGAIDICASADAFIHTLRHRAHGHGLRSTRWIAETHTWPAIAARFARLLTDVTELHASLS